MPLGGWAVIDGFCSALTSLRASTLSSWWSCSTTFTALAKQGQVQFNAIRLYSVGGFHGISRATEQFESVVKYLNHFMKEQLPGQVWTSLYVSHNTQAPLHRDVRNALGFPVVVRAVGQFKGGGLWIEGEDAQGPVCKLLPNGDLRAGQVFDIRKEAICFWGNRWHAAEDWEGPSRWVIAGFVPAGYKRTTPEQWARLSELGLPVGTLASDLEGSMVSQVQVADEEASDCALNGKLICPAGL